MSGMTDSDLPDWVVFRFSDDMPVSHRPPDLDGLWIDRNDVPSTQSIEAARRASEQGRRYLVGEAVAHPTERLEVSEDGRVAQVWEIRPLWKSDEQ
jgi:hypothetical protein